MAAQQQLDLAMVLAGRVMQDGPPFAVPADKFTSNDQLSKLMCPDLVAYGFLGSASVGGPGGAPALLDVEDGIAAFRQMHPLVRCSKGLRFVHRSLRDYLFARLLLHTANGAPSLERVSRCTHALSIPLQRLAADTEVLQFLGLLWHAKRLKEPLFCGRVRSCWLAVVGAPGDSAH
jgi:hypothetical protein